VSEISSGILDSSALRLRLSESCLRLEEEHEMYVRERQDLASDQAQSREMHDAWCARPENGGTGFCEGVERVEGGQGPR